MLKTRSCWVLWQTTPGHTCHPLTLEDIGAQWHVWSFWPRTVQISMLWLVRSRKRWRIPRLEMNGSSREYVATSRAGHDMLNPLSIKARFRSWWCRQTVIGHRARGRHLLHHWCRVQARVALSICEADLHAPIQSLQELLSFKYLMQYLQHAECRTLKRVAEVDSTACTGTTLRHGVGQLKHLATRTMWAQHVLQQDRLKYDGSHVP